MKKLYCGSDIGSCLIGNKDWTFAVPNIGGDGETLITIFDAHNIDFEEYKKKHNLKLISSAQGQFNIYSYDCAFENDCQDKDILETLSGRYGVYQGNMEVAFVKWC